MPKDTNKLTLERMPKNEDLGSEPFGDTVLQASLSVSGSKLKKPSNAKKIETVKIEETSTELSTSSNQKYYYYPTSFPSNRNPYPTVRSVTKNFHKRPRAEINHIKPPQNHKRYIPASVVSERKDVVSNQKNSKSKTVYYHTPETQETLIRPERNCKYRFNHCMLIKLLNLNRYLHIVSFIEYNFQQIIKLMKISTHTSSHTHIIIALLLPIRPHNPIPHLNLYLHHIIMCLIRVQKVIYQKNVS